MKMLVSSEDGDSEVETAAEELDDGIDPSQLVHESMSKPAGKGKSSRLAAKSKHIPEDETPDQRDARTIFIGNLSVEVAQKKVRLPSVCCKAKL
jgi:nucleolar protein 12